MSSVGIPARGAVWFVFFVSWPLAGQVCRLSVAGLNQGRMVTGNVNAECPLVLHSAPFGNWGVSSNFGGKGDSHQFDGWCHNTRICDNLGFCRTDCRDGWYEWNSCTDNAVYKAPNCSLYNASDCTEQVTATGINVHGTTTVDVAVSCPADADGDGVLETGGCADVKTAGNGDNYMSLYELDPFQRDELVQTLYFPPTPVPLMCTPWNCPAAGSEWVEPIAWQSPAEPRRVWTQMAMVVNGGVFIDSGGRCAAARRLSVLSAASLAAGLVARDSIATATGEGLAAATETASLPLPYSLGGTSVRVRDSAGEDRPTQLYFVSPGQVNYVIPADTAGGPATVTVYQGPATIASGSVTVASTAAGIFTANSTGRGAPAANVVRVLPDSTESTEPAFDCSAGAGRCVPAALYGLESDDLILVLFGTGIRGRSTVRAWIGGVQAEVLSEGPDPDYPGLDQVRARIPKEVAGRGLVQVELMVDSRPANRVTIDVR